MQVLVDLPAVRAGRHARAVRDDAIAGAVRDLRGFLRGAQRDDLADGIRLCLEIDLPTLAGLADEIRALGGTWPFLHLRLLMDPPRCWLEVRGQDDAATFARVVFGEIAG